MKTKHEIGVDLTNFYAERKEIEQALKPCPFCGNGDLELSLIHPQYNGKPDMEYWSYWEVLCPECGANMENSPTVELTGWQEWEDAKQELIETWNRRAENGYKDAQAGKPMLDDYYAKHGDTEPREDPEEESEDLFYD